MALFHQKLTALLLGCVIYRVSEKKVVTHLLKLKIYQVKQTLSCDVYGSRNNFRSAGSVVNLETRNKYLININDNKTTNFKREGRGKVKLVQIFQTRGWGVFIYLFYFMFCNHLLQNIGWVQIRVKWSSLESASSPVMGLAESPGKLSSRTMETSSETMSPTRRRGKQKCGTKLLTLTWK